MALFLKGSMRQFGSTVAAPGSVRFLSSAAPVAGLVTEDHATGMKHVRIHPESQVVLEHLQGPWSDWTQSRGLDRGLKINNDGTFMLRFPRCNWRIWTFYDDVNEQHWLKVDTGDMFSRYLLRDRPKLVREKVDYADLGIYGRKLRKRAIVMVPDDTVPEENITRQVDAMIERLTKWGK
mmetsp:Transcript_5609/g.11700  ORF Transcript_5609/g.11700 Transcript_5609/m.11700 type:complete len:179 (-) Transcript_5609:131-667(-)